MAAEFDVNAVLRKTTFTIPVELTDSDEDGKVTKHIILVTYHYDHDIKEKYKAGVMQTVDVRKQVIGEEVVPVIDPNVPPKDRFVREERRRDFDNREQLAMLVTKIRGVSDALDEAYWGGVPPKHQEAIVQAVMEDVFPSMKTSVG